MGTNTSKKGARTPTLETRHYPAEGYFRPAATKHWWVVREADGREVTRDLPRGVAERFL
jgi:hypothetical protein